MQMYLIDGNETSVSDPEFEHILEHAYMRQERPRCLCNRSERLYLYIAKRAGKYILARWPGSGNNHAPDCEHFEAPDFLTGLGQVNGNAILDDKDTGETLLKFAFPLSKGAARAAPNSITNDKPVVKATVQRLTMRGVLHYLWERSQLTHWSPRMTGKRNWYVVRREILSALVNCKVRGEALARVIFVPETFNLDRKEEIAGRRRENLAIARASREAIMIVVGEIKGFRKSDFGEQILIKHLPDWPFLLDDLMAKRFHDKFKTEESLHAAAPDRTKLIMAASFAIGRAQLPEIFEVSIMVVSNHWLPIEKMDELDLVDKAVQEGRRFVKGLRFNLDVDKRIVSLVLSDTGSQPTAVYLEEAMPNAEQDHGLTEMLDARQIRYVMWRPGQRLPAKQFRPAPPRQQKAEHGHFGGFEHHGQDDFEGMHGGGDHYDPETGEVIDDCGTGGRDLVPVHQAVGLPVVVGGETSRSLVPVSRDDAGVLGGVEAGRAHRLARPNWENAPRLGYDGDDSENP